MSKPAETFVFRRSNRAQVFHIAGCQTSLQNNQLLTSTGIPSLDKILGGVPVGSVILLEEDTYQFYSDIILRYFLSEGVVNAHSLYVSSAQHHPQQLVQSIPAVVEATESCDGAEDTKMSIAWRYQHKASLQIGDRNDVGHFFDLTKTMSRDLIDATHITTHQASPTHSDSYHDMLLEIADLIESQSFGTGLGKPPSNVLRIGIQSVASPLWPTCDAGVTLPKFLYALRSLVRYSFSIAMVTVPSHLLHTSSQHVAHAVSDTVIRLDSFAGSTKATNPLFKDYHGLLHVVKHASLNCLTHHTPHAEDLAFKLRRKKFTIEKLHLPPELSETVSRIQGKNVGCSGDIDF